MEGTSIHGRAKQNTTETGIYGGRMDLHLHLRRIRMHRAVYVHTYIHPISQLTMRDYLPLNGHGTLECCLLSLVPCFFVGPNIFLRSMHLIITFTNTTSTVFVGRFPGFLYFFFWAEDRCFDWTSEHLPIAIGDWYDELDARHCFRCVAGMEIRVE